MEPIHSRALQVEDIGRPRPGLLLKNVFSSYGSQFSRWFSITAPTSLLAAAVIWVANQRITAINRNIPFGEMKYHVGEIAAMMALRFGSYFVSWLLGCFALAGIATVVNNLGGEDVDLPWRHDSHQLAREHFGALVLAAAFTFCAFLAGMVVAGFVQSTAVHLVGWSHFARYSYGVSLASAVVVASIVAWLGMAIPLIIGGNTNLWAAVKKSVELSDGYEGALFLLVVESTAGSYAAWYAIYYGMQLLFPVHLKHTLWYGWLVFLVAVLAGAAVDPPIFIGFSLLADPDQLKVSALPVSQHSPHIHELR